MMFSKIEATTFKIIKRVLREPYTSILLGKNSLPEEFNKKSNLGIRIPDITIAL
jgi:tRNA A37 threonylcarbamoyladenosine synthetase subunit TsaC/SUA5/YrdC